MVYCFLVSNNGLFFHHQDHGMAKNSEVIKANTGFGRMGLRNISRQIERGIVSFLRVIEKCERKNTFPCFFFSYCWKQVVNKADIYNCL